MNFKRKSPLLFYFGISFLTTAFFRNNRLNFWFWQQFFSAVFFTK